MPYIFKTPQIQMLGLFSDIADEIDDWLDERISDLVKDIIESILEFVAQGIMNCYTEIISYNNAIITDEFWNASVINSFLDFAQFCALILFGVGAAFLIFDVVQEYGQGKSVAWLNVIKGFVVGFLFAKYSQILPVYFCQKVLYILGNFTFSAEADISWRELPSSGKMVVGLVIYVIMILVMLIATIVFLCVFLSRQAALLIHIMSAMFYVPEVTKGDTSKLAEWLRQLVALLATTFFQYLFFFGGSAMVLTEPILGSAMFFCGLALMFGSFSVPKVLNSFGYSVGNRDVLSTVQGYASSGYYIKSMIKR